MLFLGEKWTFPWWWDKHTIKSSKVLATSWHHLETLSLKAGGLKAEGVVCLHWPFKWRCERYIGFFGMFVGFFFIFLYLILVIISSDVWQLFWKRTQYTLRRCSADWREREYCFRFWRNSASPFLDTISHLDHHYVDIEVSAEWGE